MRVLHVTDVYLPQVGGIEVFVDDLAREQSARHDVTVLASTPDRGSAPAVGVTGPQAVLRRGVGPFDWVPDLRGIDLASYDVVHGHLSIYSPFSTAVAMASVRAGVPTVLSVHSLWSGWSTAVRIIGMVGGWQRAPLAWTAVSNVTVASMRPVLRHHPIAVVPNAVDVDWWRHGPPHRERTPDDPVTIVAVMRLAERKRPMALVGMLAAARRQVPPDIALRAVIVGSGPLEAKVTEALHEAGIADWVELAGFRSRAEIRDLYRTADIYVAPAFRESFGIAALEARSAGVPVVAMRSGGVGGFVHDDTEGVLCDDDDDMAGALARLATESDKLELMARQCRAVAPALCWRTVLDGFDDEYDRARELAASYRSGRRRRRLRSEEGSG